MKLKIVLVITRSRINAPGVLNHIIIRGIERRYIFEDGLDRNDFMNRLSVIFTKTKTRCQTNKGR